MQMNSKWIYLDIKLLYQRRKIYPKRSHLFQGNLILKNSKMMIRWVILVKMKWKIRWIKKINHVKEKMAKITIIKTIKIIITKTREVIEVNKSKFITLGNSHIINLTQINLKVHFKTFNQCLILNSVWDNKKLHLIKCSNTKKEILTEANLRITEVEDINLTIRTMAFHLIIISRILNKCIICNSNKLKCNHTIIWKDNRREIEASKANPHSTTTQITIEGKIKTTEAKSKIINFRDKICRATKIIKCLIKIQINSRILILGFLTKFCYLIFMAFLNRSLSHLKKVLMDQIQMIA